MITVKHILRQILTLRYRIGYVDATVTVDAPHLRRTAAQTYCCQLLKLMDSAVSVSHCDTAKVIQGLLPASGLLLFFSEIIHYDNVIFIGAYLETGTGAGRTVQRIDCSGDGRVRYVVRCHCNGIKCQLNLTTTAGIIGSGIHYELHLLQIVSEIKCDNAHSLNIRAFHNYSLGIVTHSQHTHESGQRTES